jgi:hypothetical protein
MALPTISNLESMNSGSLWAAFARLARYIPDAPVQGPLYAVRVGSKTLYDNDTMELYKKFRQEIAQRKRAKTLAHARTISRRERTD